MGTMGYAFSLLLLLLYWVFLSTILSIPFVIVVALMTSNLQDKSMVHDPVMRSAWSPVWRAIYHLMGTTLFAYSWATLVLVTTLRWAIFSEHYWAYIFFGGWIALAVGVLPGRRESVGWKVLESLAFYGLIVIFLAVKKDLAGGLLLPALTVLSFAWNSPWKAVTVFAALALLTSAISRVFAAPAKDAPPI